MNVLHLVDEPWDSGLTAYAIRLVQLLADNKVSVKIGLIPGKSPDKEARGIGLDVLAVRSFVDVLKVFRSESWDIVNAHTGRSHTWALLARALVPKQKNVVIIRTRGDARPVANNFRSRFVYQHTNAVITASQHIEAQYRKGILRSSTILKTIYPSVQYSTLPAPLPDNIIGILGRLDPVKGHATFIEAASRIVESWPEARFLVAGKEAGVKISVLKNQAEQLGLGNKIEFLGFQASASEFIKKCRIGVVCSLGSEEVSRACLEWMAEGRPVVGTLVGCLPELIETGETGLLVPPQDSIALGDAVLEILKNPDRAIRLGANAHRKVEKEFSSAIFVQNTMDLYKETIRRSMWT